MRSNNNYWRHTLNRHTTTETRDAYDDNFTWHAMNTGYINSTNETSSCVTSIVRAQLLPIVCWFYRSAVTVDLILFQIKIISSSSIMAGQNNVKFLRSKNILILNIMDQTCISNQKTPENKSLVERKQRNTFIYIYYMHILIIILWYTITIRMHLCILFFNKLNDLPPKRLELIWNDWRRLREKDLWV